MNPIGNEKSYIPDETLVNFIQDWLHLHKKRAALTLAGKELSEEEKNRIRELDRMKVYVLDTFIFPAMANLIYFFEATAASQRFSEAFDDDIEELLDPRKVKSAATFGGNRMRFSSMQFRTNNLARLITAMLGIHKNRVGMKQPITNFRVGLIYQLQNIIGDVMDDLISNEFSFGNQIWKSACEDYDRMMGWLGLLARSVEEHPGEYDRKIGFWPIWLSDKTPTHEIEF